MTTFANKIDGNDIYAKRAECDKDGNVIEPSNVFIAKYGTTTYNEILSAYNSGKMIIAYDNDQEFLLKQKGSSSFIFSGLRSRSWLSQDYGYPCVSELICESNDSWKHNWYPLSSIINCSSEKIYFDSNQNKFCYGSGASEETLALTKAPSNSAQTAVNSIISKIDNVLSAGQVPILKFRRVNEEYYTDFEYFLHMIRRGCCGFFFEWPDKKMVNVRNAAGSGIVTIMQNGFVFIGGITYSENSYYSIGIDGDG